MPADNEWFETLKFSLPNQKKTARRERL